MGGLIIINTDNYPTFCDNRCDNTNCSRHISKMRFHKGGCKISKLRDTRIARVAYREREVRRNEPRQ